MTKQKTEMEMEMVGDIKDAEDNEMWRNARSISQERNARRRELRKALSLVVKHNTPIEQVCMNATLLRMIEDVFSTTQAPAIMGRLGNCEATKLRAGATLPQDIYAMYKATKKAYEEGTLTLAEVCELSEKGVKMDKYAFSFYVVRSD